MSLVENLINQISTKGLGGITNPQSFDMEDDTFSKLLEKGMNAYSIESQPANSIGQMGMPAGFIIEAFDGVNFSETAQDQLEILGEKMGEKTPISTDPIEIKDLDMSDFFSNLLKASGGENNDFMNFAKKQASNAYGSFKRTYVNDVKDFVRDLKSVM